MTITIHEQLSRRNFFQAPVAVMVLVRDRFLRQLLFVIGKSVKAEMILATLRNLQSPSLNIMISNLDMHFSTQENKKIDQDQSLHMNYPTL